MGLFDKIFGPRKTLKAVNGYFKTLTAYQPVFTSWQGGIYESELCRAAIDAIARNCAKLNVEILGKAKPTLKTQLSKAPNEFQTWYQFMYRLATILAADNTAFIVPILDRYDDVKGIFPVLPSRCTIVQYGNTPYLQYEFMSGDKAAIELSMCGLMTRHQYKDDFFGESNNVLNPTMDLIHMQNQGIKEGIKNGAAYRFSAQLGNFSTDEDLALERKRFNKENFEKEQGGGLLLFPATYKDIKQLDAKTYVVEAEQMKIIRTNVFDYFGVNEAVLQNKAYGDEWNAFYEGCIEPFAIQFSEVVTKMLYSAPEQAHGSEVMATSNRLQYMSNADKLNVTTGLLDRGIITINQALDIWNLPHVENGDVRIIRGEYYNADDKTEISGGTSNAEQDK